MSGRRLLVRCAAALGALAAGGCAAPRDHFYTLTPLPAVARPGGAPRTTAVILRVRLSPGLDRSEMILHTSGDEVQVLEHERWLGLPSDQLAATLGLDLETRRGDLLVGGDDALAAGAAPLRVTVDVVRMSVALSGNAVLEAHWHIVDPGAHTDSVGDGVLSAPLDAAAPGGVYAGVASAFSRDLAALADRLLESLPQR